MKFWVFIQKLIEKHAVVTDAPPIPEGYHFSYHECKVAVIGRAAAGKTALLHTLCQLCMLLLCLSNLEQLTICFLLYSFIN